MEMSVVESDTVKAIDVSLLLDEFYTVPLYSFLFFINPPSKKMHFSSYSSPFELLQRLKAISVTHIFFLTISNDDFKVKRITSFSAVRQCDVVLKWRCLLSRCQQTHVKNKATVLARDLFRTTPATFSRVCLN